MGAWSACAVALLSAVAGALPAAPAQARALPQIGIADQKPDMFSDPRFAGLGIKHARIAVSWDILRYPNQVAQLDVWMGGARARGIDPLITFGHSRAHSKSLPSPIEYRRQFRAFRERYPWATTFATWNEVNHCGEKVCRRAPLIAAYYRQLRRECPACTVVAAEVIDLPNMAVWVRQFRHALGFMPRLWGMHNYVEVNRFKSTSIRRLLHMLGRRGQLWLTETGGLVRRTNKSTTDIPEGPRHAARVLRYLFDDVVKDFVAIKRVYVYHWNAGPPSTTWDSALITYGGHERGAYWVLQRVIRDGLK
jgi:hypothetical protein